MPPRETRQRTRKGSNERAIKNFKRVIQISKQKDDSDAEFIPEDLELSPTSDASKKGKHSEDGEEETGEEEENPYEFDIDKENRNEFNEIICASNSKNPKELIISYTGKSLIRSDIIVIDNEDNLNPDLKNRTQYLIADFKTLEYSGNFISNINPKLVEPVSKPIKLSSLYVERIVAHKCIKGKVFFCTDYMLDHSKLISGLPMEEMPPMSHLENFSSPLIDVDTSETTTAFIKENGTFHLVSKQEEDHSKPSYENQRINGESNCYFLVKWRGIPEDKATWETYESILGSNREFHLAAANWADFSNYTYIYWRRTLPDPNNSTSSTDNENLETPHLKHNIKLSSQQEKMFSFIKHCFDIPKTAIIKTPKNVGRIMACVAYLNLIYTQLNHDNPSMIVTNNISSWIEVLTLSSYLYWVEFNDESQETISSLEFKSPLNGDVPKFEVLLITPQALRTHTLTLTDILWDGIIFDEQPQTFEIPTLIMKFPSHKLYIFNNQITSFSLMQTDYLVLDMSNGSEKDSQHFHIREDIVLLNDPYPKFLLKYFKDIIMCESQNNNNIFSSLLFITQLFYTHPFLIPSIQTSMIRSDSSLLDDNCQGIISSSNKVKFVIEHARDAMRNDYVVLVVTTGFNIIRYLTDIFSTIKINSTILNSPSSTEVFDPNFKNGVLLITRDYYSSRLDDLNIKEIIFYDMGESFSKDLHISEFIIKAHCADAKIYRLIANNSAELLLFLNYITDDSFVPQKLGLLKAQQLCKEAFLIIHHQHKLSKQTDEIDDDTYYSIDHVIYPDSIDQLKQNIKKTLKSHSSDPTNYDKLLGNSIVPYSKSKQLSVPTTSSTNQKSDSQEENDKQNQKSSPKSTSTNDNQSSQTTQQNSSTSEHTTTNKKHSTAIVDDGPPDPDENRRPTSKEKSLTKNGLLKILLGPNNKTSKSQPTSPIKQTSYDPKIYINANQKLFSAPNKNNFPDFEWDQLDIHTLIDIISKNGFFAFEAMTASFETSFPDIIETIKYLLTYLLSAVPYEQTFKIHKNPFYYTPRFYLEAWVELHLYRMKDFIRDDNLFKDLYAGLPNEKLKTVVMKEANSSKVKNHLNILLDQFARRFVFDCYKMLNCFKYPTRFYLKKEDFNNINMHNGEVIFTRILKLNIKINMMMAMDCLSFALHAEQNHIEYIPPPLSIFIQLYEIIPKTDEWTDDEVNQVFSMLCQYGLPYNSDGTINGEEIIAICGLFSKTVEEAAKFSAAFLESILSFSNSFSLVIPNELTHSQHVIEILAEKIISQRSKFLAMIVLRRTLLDPEEKDYNYNVITGNWDNELDIPLFKFGCQYGIDAAKIISEVNPSKNTEGNDVHPDDKEMDDLLNFEASCAGKRLTFITSTYSITTKSSLLKLSRSMLENLPTNTNNNDTQNAAENDTENTNENEELPLPEIIQNDDEDIPQEEENQTQESQHTSEEQTNQEMEQLQQNQDEDIDQILNSPTHSLAQLEDFQSDNTVPIPEFSDSDNVQTNQDSSPIQDNLKEQQDKTQNQEEKQPEIISEDLNQEPPVSHDEIQAESKSEEEEKQNDINDSKNENQNVEESKSEDVNIEEHPSKIGNQIEETSEEENLIPHKSEDSSHEELNSQEEPIIQEEDLNQEESESKPETTPKALSEENNKDDDNMKEIQDIHKNPEPQEENLDKEDVNVANLPADESNSINEENTSENSNVSPTNTDLGDPIIISSSTTEDEDDVQIISDQKSSPSEEPTTETQEQTNSSEVEQNDISQIQLLQAIREKKISETDMMNMIDSNAIQPQCLLQIAREGLINSNKLNKLIREDKVSPEIIYQLIAEFQIPPSIINNAFRFLINNKNVPTNIIIDLLQKYGVNHPNLSEMIHTQQGQDFKGSFVFSKEVIQQMRYDGRPISELIIQAENHTPHHQDVQEEPLVKEKDRNTNQSPHNDQTDYIIYRKHPTQQINKMINNPDRQLQEQLKMMQIIQQNYAQMPQQQVSQIPLQQQFQKEVQISQQKQNDEPIQLNFTTIPYAQSIFPEKSSSIPLVQEHTPPPLVNYHPMKQYQQQTNTNDITIPESNQNNTKPTSQESQTNETNRQTKIKLQLPPRNINSTNSSLLKMSQTNKQSTQQRRSHLSTPLDLPASKLNKMSELLRSNSSSAQDARTQTRQEVLIDGIRSFTKSHMLTEIHQKRKEKAQYGETTIDIPRKDHKSRHHHSKADNSLRSKSYQFPSSKSQPNDRYMIGTIQKQKQKPKPVSDGVVPDPIAIFQQDTPNSNKK